MTPETSNYPDFLLNCGAFSNQWYLLNRGQTKGVRGADCNVLPAWEHTRGDPNITVAIIDGGFDMSYPSIGRTGTFRDAFDACNGELQPSAASLLGAHGTPCAGLAVGCIDEKQPIGVAPDCSWMPIRHTFSLAPIIANTVYYFI